MTASMLRKVLNLPEAPARDDEQEHDERAPQPPAGGDSAPRQGAGWVADAEPGRRRAARVAGRALIYCLAGLMVLLGVRSLFVHPGRVTAAPSSTFPVQQAQAVAARFTTSYLTASDDEAAKKQRDALLALDVAPGADVDTDWTGSTATTATNVTPGTVTMDGSDTATVTVLAYLRQASQKSTSSSSSSNAASTSGSAWVGLSVPVRADEGAVSVVGTPAFVALPSPPNAGPPQSSATVDTATTSETREGAAAFFGAYAGRDPGAVDQAAAPGADIQPLGGLVTFGSLDAWTVEAGGAQTRTAHATVTWVLRDTRIQQSYRLTLAAISAGDARAWRVQQITADH